MSTPQRPVSYTPPRSGRPDIPLAAEPAVDTSQSVGALVKEASVHLSTLVRSEIELAKLEITATVKTALTGSIFFAAAGVIGVVALAFVWFVLAEVLDTFLPRWLSFLIVFVLMLVIAGVLALLGLRKIKKIGKPERTIASLNETASVLKTAATHNFGDKDGDPALAGPGTPAAAALRTAAGPGVAPHTPLTTSAGAHPITDN